ncbi:C-type lectin domain family 4 member D-like, partial [Saccostrea cucullata]|uniref:C-type lectin domain family 4 member D-like n=1 Tax=Saccostrea cuccullata TaxID=36930 RepID=UPI002ED4E799
CGIPHVEGADINNTDRWDGIGILRRMYIKCYQEFYLTGSRFLTCQSTGAWTMGPSCEWKMYEDHIYLLQASNLTWQEAKEKCEGFQAYLTEINSENENIWITNTLMNPFFGNT